MNASAGPAPRWRQRAALSGIPLAVAGLIVFALYAGDLTGNERAEDLAPVAAGQAEPAGRVNAAAGQVESRDGTAGAAAEAALTITALRVTPVELARTISVNGQIHAWQEVIIGPEVGGYRVAEVHVDVGDEVKKGEELVELSSALLEAEVALKRATLEQRDAELVNAQAALRRARELSSSDLLAAAELDRIESEALAAEARVASARADLETSALRLELAHVRAPDDGVITARNVAVGQIAQVGEEMLRLLRQGRVEWRGEVPEARLTEIEVGQPVTVTTAGGARIEGKVRIVSPTVANANHTGIVYVDLESAKHARPGMFARGEIELGRGPALTVPLESIVTADGYSYVYVVRDDGTVERRRLRIGRVNGASVEVVEGLAAGERIAVAGAGFLKDGDLVNVAREE